MSWPDDSSYHLARALPPGRRAAWLDLGCGSAFAPLLRPNLADTIVCTDLNPRALQFARLGAELSGIAHVTFGQADVADGLAIAAPLISCKAPIPEPRWTSRWRATDDTFFTRLVADATRCVTSDGLVVVHGVVSALARPSRSSPASACSSRTRPRGSASSRSPGGAPVPHRGS